jgi:hypothetical protein
VHLVQLLLPVKPDCDHHIARVREELVEHFDGVTAYVRAPARGAWVASDGQEEHDDIIMIEVVVGELDRGWWRQYRETLAARFREEQIHLRVLPAEVL